MMDEKIKAGHIYARDLFSDKYLFEIPDFQRPFAWEKDNFEQLFDDIKEALQTNQKNYGDKIEDYEPYFIGSIILWAKELGDDGSGKYALIDGQQRIVSLAILMAVMRDLVNDQKAKNTLQGRIYQERDDYSGTIESVRIQIRDKEKLFFKQYVLDSGGTSKINDIDRKSLSEPILHMLEAVEIFQNGFGNENGNANSKLLENYIKYLLQKVVIVVVKTDSLSSAFRLFNIINARGMPLTNADLLKSENLSVIPEVERQKYTQMWENIGEDIGSEALEMLISFIRSVKLKERAERAIFEEFEKKVFEKEPEFKGRKFVEYLDRVKNIYREKVVDGHLQTGNSDEEIYYYNLISIMRDFLPFNDWMAAVIQFREKFDDESYLFKFLKNFERKLVVDWVIGLSLTERLTRIYRVIRLIEEKANPDAVLSDSAFNDEIKVNEKSFENALSDINFYNKGRTRIPKYILLRIDMERKYNQNVKLSYAGAITVEHILPRTPTHKYWLDRFNELSRIEWTNRFGNLVLLNNRKNSQASNKPFPDKVNDYFEKRSDFEITNELKRYSEWTLETLKGRHQKFKKDGIKMWIGEEKANNHTP